MTGDTDVGRETLPVWQTRENEIGAETCQTDSETIATS